MARGGEDVGAEGFVAGREDGIAQARGARSGRARGALGTRARREGEEGGLGYGQQAAEGAQVAPGRGGGGEEFGEVRAFQERDQLGVGEAGVVAAGIDEPGFGAGDRRILGVGGRRRGLGGPPGAGPARGGEAVGLPESVEAREQARGATDAVEQQLQHQGVRLPRRDGRGEETDDGADGRDDVDEVAGKR